MASEITYAEVKFKNESKSEPPAAPKEKTSAHQGNPGFPKQLLVSLLILLLLVAIAFLIAFIIFFQRYSLLLKEKKKPIEVSYNKVRCEKMNSTVKVNTQEEQNFITRNLEGSSAYYVGLSDPEGKNQWQWVDGSPYNESTTFWRPGEPSHRDEQCVMINSVRGSWGWNDAHCDAHQRSICEMKKVYF
ncbi:C-type lectin domain family 4 member A [Echinops telfairi]|uniref:C-type lectin domain family 4 member A n=1 Tax=Echinops telfairi TaxID=9371 RepID=A0ABM0ZRR5_ECHTE|nr:C-type lectin domain family 4 member A [Echinops telfairi]